MIAGERIHATCVAIRGRALLLTGPSGSGKSDLALRLIDRGATLVSDDQVLLVARAGRLFAAPPPSIAGKMEVRGLGIIAMAHHSDMPVSLIIELGAEVPRMPEWRVRALAGLDIPVIALPAFDPSAPLKAELALREIGL